MTKLTETLNIFESSFQGLKETARLVLTVAATTRLQRRHPLAVILVGNPSSGKTSVLMPLTRGTKDSAIGQQVFRVDDFSAASLVSHAANRSEEQLQKQDLLPKMKDKVVIAKEMAPVFNGHEEDLTKKFGMFASVLDGEGYVSSSGSHGERGYREPILFSLIGAVTPRVLSGKVISTLEAVGPRFCFWEMPDRPIDPITWRGPDETRPQSEDRATGALTTFVDELFTAHPPNSIPRSHFQMSGEIWSRLSMIAVLMSTLRSNVIVDRDDSGTVLGYQPSPESPDRAFRYLEQIVLGSALIDDRREINEADLKLALGVAIGSAVSSRRKLMRVMMESTGKMSVGELAEAMGGITTDTASKYCDHVTRLGLIKRVNPDGVTEWDLTPPFDSLRYIYNPNLIRPDELRRMEETP